MPIQPRKDARDRIIDVMHDHYDEREHYVVGDILTDLMHYCAAYGESFEAFLASAREHFHCEAVEPDDFELDRRRMEETEQD